MKEQFFRIREDLCPYDPYTGEKRKNKITLHKDDIVLQKSECLTHMFGSYYKVQYGIYNYDVEVEYLKPIKENTEEYNKAYEEYYKVLDKQIEERKKIRSKEMTIEKFDRAKEIKSIQNCLRDLYQAMNVPHPEILNNNSEICFIGLGEKYENELKNLIKKFIMEKNEELKKEFEEL